MPKLNLLKTEKDFEAFRQSKSFQSESLRIRVLPRPNQNHPRFGFIVPKKVLPKVVDRNVLKRRIKTFLVKNADQVKSVDVLIFPGKNLLKKKFTELETELNQLFSKARLWKS